MSKNPTSYLLFVYGTFGEDESDIRLFVEMMGEQFFDVVSDEYLPYTIGPYHAIYKFNSSYEFKDIKQRIDEQWHNMCHSYFLMEITDNMSYKMSEGEDTFFGAKIDDNTNEEGYYRYNDLKDYEIKFMDDELINIFMELKKAQEEAEEDDEEDEKIKEIKKKNKKRVITIDDVLEKIASQGIENITKQEKQILDNYAHGK